MKYSFKVSIWHGKVDEECGQKEKKNCEDEGGFWHPLRFVTYHFEWPENLLWGDRCVGCLDGC